MKAIKVIFIVFLVQLFISQANSQVPNKINFQGRLEENGEPVNGTKTFVFKIYDAPSGGNLIWTSQTQNVQVVDGVFSVILQTGTPENISTATFNGARYMEIVVDGTTLSPRQEIVSAPYALIAKGLSSDAKISLSNLEKDFSQPSTINLATNPIDWTQLKNVPPDIADGIDNTSGNLLIKEGGVLKVSPATALNFEGNQFSVADNGSGEAQIVLRSSLVTLQGNTFNSANKLLLLDSSGYVPMANINPTITNKIDAIAVDTGTLYGKFQVVAQDTTTLGGKFNAVANDTTTIANNLLTETNARISGDNALSGRLDTVATDTTTLKTEINEIASSTGALKLQIDQVATSTGVLKLQIDQVAQSTGAFIEVANATSSLKTQIDDIASSTGALKLQIDDVATSTGALKLEIEQVAQSTGVFIEVANATTSLKLQIDDIANSTGSLKAQMDQIAISTGTFIEVANATAALRSDLIAETNARINADNDLMSRFNSVANDTTTIMSNLNAEITARINGDNELINRLNSVATDTTTLKTQVDSKVSKNGDFMTGQLTTESTITVKGNAFSVGDSTFVVKEGNVGIGTVSPAAKLDVQVSGTEDFAKFGSTMVVTNSGNVGIGTTSPTTGKLVISGGNLDMTNNKIINVSFPTDNSDVATKGYVDAQSDKGKGYPGLGTAMMVKYMADNGMFTPHTNNCDSATEAFVPLWSGASVGYCIEKDERPAAYWTDAIRTCLSLGKRLPEPWEWQVACDTLGLSNMTDNWEWASNFALPMYNGSSGVGAAIFGSGGCNYAFWTWLGNSSGGRGSNAFRCVR